MKGKFLNRILAAVLTVVMVFSGVQIPAAADTQTGASQAGSFVLAAATAQKAVIEPVTVNYTAGQTVKDALKTSGYTFTGLDAGFITEIQGEVGNYSLFFSDGGYDLNASPESIAVVAFVEGELYSDNMVKLITRMAQYKEMTNHVQNYQKAKEAYSNALDGLGYADNTKAGQLLEALNAAITEYENIFKGTHYDVRVYASQGGKEYENPKLTFTDQYGNETVVTGNKVSLVAGEYTFAVSDGGYNRTEGTIQVTQNQIINVTLPSGEWFGDIKILRNQKDSSGKKIPYQYSQDKTNHKGEYFIDDVVGVTGDTYLYVQRGADIPDSSNTKLQGIYVGVNGKDYSTVTRSWESESNGLVQATVPGMNGFSFPLEAWYQSADGYKMIQSYDIVLTRIPTAKEIVLKDEKGTSLYDAFDPGVTSYTVNTTGKYVIVNAAPFQEEGYSVCVTGDAVSGSTVALKDGKNSFSVVVSHVSGRSTTYKYTVTKVAPVTITLQADKDVSVEVQNAYGSVIAPSGENAYELIPGATYTYIGTKNVNYHTSAQFQATTDSIVKVATPEVKVALNDLKLYDSANTKTRKELDCNHTFSSSVYAYEYVLADTNSALYAQTTPVTGYTATARYEKLSKTGESAYMGPYEKNITNTVSATKTATMLTYAAIKGAFRSDITLRLWKTSSGVTYYQDYSIGISRSLHLTSLTASTSLQELTFVDDKNEQMVFSKDVFEYRAVVSSDTTEIKAEAHFADETDYNTLCGGYYAMINGTRYEDLSALTFPLDPVQVPLSLVKAPVNETLQDLEAQWPSFRDMNNNSVVDAKSPIVAEEGTLYWANKVGEGYGSGATGCPILVDGYLYVYAGTKIVKVDAISGETVATGDMITNSSFAINNPTYGGGMIFVGLSGGKIQAFDAVTLQSLWVYEDALGGQPNCQITYKDGFIYTGFWNGEAKYANYTCISVTDEDPTDTQEAKQASWTHKQLGGFYWAGAYVSDEFMLVGTDDGESGYNTGYAHVLSIDPKTGAILSDVQLPHVGDLRSNITYDANKTGDYYFTTKGGYLYGISVDENGHFVEKSLKYVQLPNGTTTKSMSTSTPTIYNGRAYVGVAGSGQFQAYSGHNIAVVDLERMKVAYSVPTQGYPQTSGVLTTAYEEETGKVYVYFFDNYTPGKLRCFSDQKGQNKLEDITTEVNGENVYATGYVLFTPTGDEAQYAICSPIIDEDGFIYFKNDSARLMSYGPTIEKIEVTKQPDNLVYVVGKSFNPKGMKVVATYSNGATRDITKYISYSKEPLTELDNDFPIYFEHTMYQNNKDQIGVEYTAPMTTVHLEINVTIEYVEEKIAAIGEVTLDKEGKIKSARNAMDLLPEPIRDTVKNYQTLLDAEDALIGLKVPNLMERIAAIGEVTLEKGELIDGLLAEYDSLSDVNKKKVTNYKVLQNASNTLQKLRKEEEYKQAAAGVMKLISRIGEITLEKELTINQVRKAYDALTKEEKQFVSNVSDLEKAEQTIAKLKQEKEDALANAQVIQDTIDAIAAIGEVTLEKEAQIQVARAAYDGLLDSVKKNVTNYS